MKAIIGGVKSFVSIRSKLELVIAYHMRFVVKLL